jgi:hypothetical protein
MQARTQTRMQTLFTCLITLQFLVIVLHDIVHIPGWTHGRQVKQAIGPYKFWIATAINAIFPGLAAGLALVYWQQPKPNSVVSASRLPVGSLAM